MEQLPSRAASRHRRRFKFKAKWAELPSDVLTQILMCLPLASDRVRVGAVCTSWRCIELNSRCSLPLQVLGLMVQGPNSKTRNFYSLPDEKIYHSLLLPVPTTLRCVGSSNGWLVTLADNLDMAVFNPVSKVRIPLPPINKARRPGKRFRTSHTNYLYVEKAALSLSYPTAYLRPSELIVMIIHGKAGELAFARPGDDSWTFIRKTSGVCTFMHLQDILYYKENFYAVDAKGRIIRCIIEACPRLVPLVNTRFPLIPGKNYLMESLGDLFLVRRVTTIPEHWDNGLQGMDDCYMEFLRWYCSKHPEDGSNDENILPPDEGVDAEDWVIDGENGSDWQDHPLPLDDSMPCKTLFFSVYRLDIEGKRWVKTFSLDDRAFFLGWNASFSASASSFSCKADCIYFTDDFKEEHCHEAGERYDNGVFSLTDCSIEPVFPQNVDTVMPAPGWLSLVLS